MGKNKLPIIIIGVVAVLLIFIIGFSLGTSRNKAAKSETVSSVKPDLPKEENLVNKTQGEASPAVISSESTDSSKAEASLTEENKEQVAAPISTPAVAIKPEFQKGMIYVAWTESGYSNPNSVKSIEQMKALGVEWVGLVTTWYQDQYNSTQIAAIKDKTPSDQSLISAIRKLHEMKLKVMLKPHLDIVKGEGKWRGDIGFDKPEDWQKWCDSYTNFIMHYVNIAASENVELFCMGTELNQATGTQPDYWKGLIKKIRQSYKGALTYAANWHEEYSKITFWDELDYAGIDPYFPLVCTNNPKVGELKSAWDYWVKDIEAWQQKIKKPVLFTEIGYKSSSDATDEPWQHVGMGKLDTEVQANCYKAALEVFWNKPWFYGAYWWYWGTHPNMGGTLNKGFTPQNKPAQDAVKDFYLNNPVGEKNFEAISVKEPENAAKPAQEVTTEAGQNQTTAQPAVQE